MPSSLGECHTCCIVLLQQRMMVLPSIGVMHAVRQCHSSAAAVAFAAGRRQQWQWQWQWEQQPQWAQQPQEQHCSSSRQRQFTAAGAIAIALQHAICRQNPMVVTASHVMPFSNSVALECHEVLSTQAKMYCCRCCYCLLCRPMMCLERGLNQGLLMRQLLAYILDLPRWPLPSHEMLVVCSLGTVPAASSGSQA
jgi:hypothetical protein